MRVLMLTQIVDRHDPLLGFTHGWIDRLAQQVQQLDVICLYEGAHDLPQNVSVYSMGKEKGYNRWQKLRAYLELLARLVPTADIIFGHMIPRYSLLAMPYALWWRRPLAHWHTHKTISLEMRIVHQLATRIVTASPESFPLPSRKVSIIGHGIDLDQFQPAEAPTSRKILAVGRLSPIKHYEVLIDAADILLRQEGMDDVEVQIAGGSTEEHGDSYARSLKDRVENTGLVGRIHFLGVIPFHEIGSYYRQAALTVNLCPTGGADKAVLESMATGVPVIFRNRTFLPLLEPDMAWLWVESLEPAILAARLADAMKLPYSERRALGLRLRQRMADRFGLDGLVIRLVGVMREVTRQ